MVIQALADPFKNLPDRTKRQHAASKVQTLVVPVLHPSIKYTASPARSPADRLQAADTQSPASSDTSVVGLRVPSDRPGASERAPVSASALLVLVRAASSFSSAPSRAPRAPSPSLLSPSPSPPPPSRSRAPCRSARGGCARSRTRRTASASASTGRARVWYGGVGERRDGRGEG